MKGTLTKCEDRVVQECLKGKALKVVAHELGMAESTIKVHLRSIGVKMGVRTRIELVVAVFSQRLAEKDLEIAGLKDKLAALQAPMDENTLNWYKRGIDPDAKG